jgi:hypothetical protein
VQPAEDGRRVQLHGLAPELVLLDCSSSGLLAVDSKAGGAGAVVRDRGAGEQGGG